MKNIFKNKSFYIALSVTIGILIVLALFMAIYNNEPEVFYMALLLMYIPYSVFGVIISALLIRKNKSAALGIFLGSLLIFTIISIFSGGIGGLNNGPPRR